MGFRRGLSSLELMYYRFSFGVSEMAHSTNVPCVDGDVEVSEVTLHILVGGTLPYPQQ